jgi:aspartate racemase
MKVIGLIGGMSWQSSALYYQLINEETQRRLGGHHNAKTVMLTVDFAEVERLQHAGDWDSLGILLADSAKSVERAGAGLLVLCTNTMHKLAGHITAAVDIPLLHIVDATAAALQQDGHRTVGLLATRFTMEEPFYRDRLRANFGIETLTPDSETRGLIHRVIYQELCHGVFCAESRTNFATAIQQLQQAGATAVILGCTEIELLISQADSPLSKWRSGTKAPRTLRPRRKRRSRFAFPKHGKPPPYVPFASSF